MMTTPEGVEPPRGDSSSGSPLRSLPVVYCILSVYVFSISTFVPRGIAIVAPLIDGFRSRRKDRHEDGQQRSHEDEMGPSGATGPISALSLAQVRSKFSVTLVLIK
jgi:hypothetical protein